MAVFPLRVWRWAWNATREDQPVLPMLRRHFGRIKPSDLTIAERQFPFRVRADLQRAIEQVLALPGQGSGGGDGRTRVRNFCGVRQEHAFEGIDFAGLLSDGHAMAVATPPQYEEIDIGEDQPVRTLKTGLWLLEHDRHRYAVLMAPAQRYAQVSGVQIQLATRNDPAGARLGESLFRALETAVNESRSYRGKILSLEQEQDYSGQSTGIKVHKLRIVAREQVILPDRTLTLLDRNIIQFVQRRNALATFGQSTKKGILFYGPPGTGKTHTLHYLARALAGHTMLLITAEQVGLLNEYMALARLLQPSVVVIEDVDLIARDRSDMNSPCEQALLNRLLNEMDGLKESADVLFILTTNRPEMLEAALASRPGRIDQAIEFPLPDEAGREKLVRLYSPGVEIADEVVAEIVKRTERVSAAFIKELMRRSAQFHLERDAEHRWLELVDITSALEEMLITGGALNVKLLGGGISHPIGYENAG